MEGSKIVITDERYPKTKGSTLWNPECCIALKVTTFPIQLDTEQSFSAFQARNNRHADTHKTSGNQKINYAHHRRMTESNNKETHVKRSYLVNTITFKTDYGNTYDSS